jgi:hypothetical protein
VEGSTPLAELLISLWHPFTRELTISDRVWLLQGSAEQTFFVQAVIGPTMDVLLLVARGRREVGLRQALASELATILVNALWHWLEICTLWHRLALIFV